MSDPPGEGASLFHPREIVAILIRRRYWVLAPMILGLLAGAVAVWMQKPMYRSSATLLIDSQQIPTSLVASPLTAVANERIAKIRQQVVSNDSLAALIRGTGVYPDERQTMRFDQVLQIMRSAIGVDLVAAEQGNGAGSTIAFTLSFTYEEPVAAQTITDRLTKLFLVEDKRLRTEQATGTAAFLERRAEELREQLARLEDKRRAIEARYAGALPAHVALSAQSGAALRAEVSRTDAETQGLVQQNSLLAVRARDDTRTTPPAGQALREAEARLSQLSVRYSDTYPEVRAARALVEQQREALRQSAEQAGDGLIETELAANHARVALLAQRRGELVRAMSEIEHRAAQAPQAAYELNMIEREYDNIKRQYESLREKQLDAQVTANLQSEDKGERFSVVDAPSLPHEPIGKKALTLLVAGLMAGGAAGVVLVVAFELMLGTIHGEASLARILNQAPLGVVPLIHRPDELSWWHPLALMRRAQAIAAELGRLRFVR